MPMYDFYCPACRTEFEDLVFGEETPVCPHCGSSDTERQVSAPSPLKTGAFPFKPGPVRPMPPRSAAPSGSCPGTACGGKGCSGQ
ncbi:MAG TPA: zinc ribbon domain-containing protein [Candidatus Mailhella merdigallinarum]|uniref:Zinc ribbon domain-containing protein n=1 Tax=Candidatus Mailhella merdigallinarum TaxID=2838658 RepID=A0A9D2HEP0_9BACT|nr:zinc ribbon domain-containing protein [Desulfovibrionaceae bacterium]PWM71050.1 MAG: transcriptional regulator [Desulfovibrionaceae bacterium]HJA08796.1 zinc ribbon domain-containing protein [Candidatus Mailhella merdigallinarum]